MADDHIRVTELTEGDERPRPLVGSADDKRVRREPAVAGCKRRLGDAPGVVGIGTDVDVAPDGCDADWPAVGGAPLAVQRDLRAGFVCSDVRSGEEAVA